MVAPVRRKKTCGTAGQGRNDETETETETEKEGRQGRLKRTRHSACGHRTDQQNQLHAHACDCVGGDRGAGGGSSASFSQVSVLPLEPSALLPAGPPVRSERSADREGEMRD